MYLLKVKDIQNGQLSLAKYGLETATTKLEPTNKVCVCVCMQCSERMICCTLFRSFQSPHPQSLRFHFCV